MSSIKEQIRNSLIQNDLNVEKVYSIWRVHRDRIEECKEEIKQEFEAKAKEVKPRCKVCDHDLEIGYPEDGGEVLTCFPCQDKRAIREIEEQRKIDATLWGKICKWFRFGLS
jgi:hypothetical protein